MVRDNEKQDPCISDEERDAVLRWDNIQPRRFNSHHLWGYYMPWDSGEKFVRVAQGFNASEKNPYSLEEQSMARISPGTIDLAKAARKRMDHRVSLRSVRIACEIFDGLAGSSKVASKKEIQEANTLVDAMLEI